MTLRKSWNLLVLVMVSWLSISIGSWTSTTNDEDQQALKDVLNEQPCEIISFGTYELNINNKCGFHIDREDLENCLMFEEQAKYYREQFENLKPVEVIESCECWYCDVRYMIGAFILGGALIWVAK